MFLLSYVVFYKDLNFGLASVGKRYALHLELFEAPVYALINLTLNDCQQWMAKMTVCWLTMPSRDMTIQVII